MCEKNRMKLKNGGQRKFVRESLNKKGSFEFEINMTTL